MSADLVDFNVNRNAWISSMLASKLGFFGIPWRNTPFFDNKAAFQLGINQVLRRTTTELVDALGRARGTSRIDQNLQDARTALAWDETAWYIGLRGPTRPTPSVYREAIQRLNAFNGSLEKCQATFDARADNLLQFLDRIAGDMGSTSDILRSQIEASNAGWFDPRADDRFWFAYGQLYAYHGILDRHPRGLLGGDPRAQPDLSVGHHADPAARHPQHAALDHLQRQRIQFPLPFASGHDGLQPVARPLPDRRNPFRAGSVAEPLHLRHCPCRFSRIRRLF